MPFDSRKYVVHFRLIQPVEKGGGGGGGGGLLSALARFNQGWGVLMLSPFDPFNQWGGGGGGVAVRFGVVQPGGGGGSPFGSFNQRGGGGGGGGAVSFWPIQSVGGGGGGIYVNFYYKGAIQSQRGGGGHGPPAPTLGTPMTGSAGLAYLVGALQVLCKPCLWC